MMMMMRSIREKGDMVNVSGGAVKELEGYCHIVLYKNTDRVIAQVSRSCLCIPYRYVSG